MAQATGIGGVFFRSGDTEALARWYETHLGVPGFWEQEAGMTVFAPFRRETDYFPPDKQWMINFRVDDLTTLMADLKKAGIAYILQDKSIFPEMTDVIIISAI